MIHCGHALEIVSRERQEKILDKVKANGRQPFFPIKKRSEHEIYTGLKEM